MNEMIDLRGVASSLKITFEAGCGTTTETCFTKAALLALIHNLPVEFTHNGKIFRVHPSKLHDSMEEKESKK